MKRENTRDAAQGRWREILIAFGIPDKILDGKHHPCPLPGCGGKDRFRFDDKEGEGTYICGQCGAGQGFKLLQKLRGWNFREAAREIDKIIGRLAKPKRRLPRQPMQGRMLSRMWHTAQPLVTNDPVDGYFRTRSISLSQIPGGLRYVPRMWHAASRKHFPCMIANFRSADNKTGTIHRTYIGATEPRRMFMPYRVPRGGAIRLFDADICMGVAEGIETALSAAILFKIPVWSCANQGMLREWQPPDCAKRITIFGDNDSSFVGQAAAYHLAARLTRDDLHVRVEIPPSPDWDWNDVLQNEIETERWPDMSAMRLADGAREPTRQSVHHAN